MGGGRIEDCVGLQEVEDTGIEPEKLKDNRQTIQVKRATVQAFFL
jgi:hypothetical protein